VLQTPTLFAVPGRIPSQQQGMGWIVQQRDIFNQVVERGLDAIFHALADPTRRSIVRRLSDGEATVSELADPFDISLAAVSKHLQVLQHAGLMVQRRQGSRPGDADRESAMTAGAPAKHRLPAERFRAGSV
jgi:DNA-binding transcriptional ArsR family regulator